MTSGTQHTKKTVLPDPRRTPRFSGICTFCRVPLLDRLAPEHAPPDWIVYGIPFDAGVTFRPGARFGPRAIREESQYIKRYSIAHDVDVCDVMSIADGGDAPVEPFDCEANARVVHAFAKSLPASSRLLAIGGDHSVAFANIQATFERFGGESSFPTGMPLIHFDSHLDTVDQTFGEKWSHASPFIRAVERGLIDPRRMLSIGIKGPLNASTDLDFSRRQGVRIISAESVHQQWDASKALIRDFVGALAGAPMYLTFDIDCVDPAFAPGTGTPSIGGFSSAQALALLRCCTGANVIGADVVEVLPDRDHAGITALLASHIAFEILSLDARRRKGP